LEEDPELKLINARRMAELRKRAEIANAAKEQEKLPAKSAKEILLGRLYDRGDEVLETAYSYYPKETAMFVEQLATYLKFHPELERISGGELYAVFRKLGLRFNLNTTIKVQEKGKFIDLKDKFKINREEDS
jgi:hypothetical protein